MNTPIIIGLIVVLAFAVLAAVVARRPSEFSVTRSANIPGPAEIIFEQVNNLHNWEAWSPWAKLDPKARTTYDGPDAGVGAVFAWVGNNKIGVGRMTITESRPNELVRFKLEFLKPFKGNNVAEFSFKPTGDQVLVTWNMSGKCNFMSKLMGLFMNCDKMVGCQFEKGLGQLKSITQSAAGKVHVHA